MTEPPATDVYNVTLLAPDGSERVIAVRRGQHLWDAAYEAGIELPALCHQGWCLTCAGRLDAPGEVDQRDSVAFFPQDRAAGYVLLCTGKPCSELRIRSHQAECMRRHRLINKLPAPYSS
ncbi:MAG: 2Fe-2S iron-sulfur cluster-binding protein [Terriglobales bacterium]